MCHLCVRTKEQHTKEIDIRYRNKLQSRFVMGICSGPSEEEITQAIADKDTNIQGRSLSQYKVGIVLHQGDRSLYYIYSAERPDLSFSKRYLREIGEALCHLHDQGVAHLDVKMQNILRYNGHLRLTDMDAATEMGQDAGAKYSSGILPPEMFFQLKNESEERMYEDHWLGCQDSSERTSRIIRTSRGAYVVRSFNDTFLDDQVVALLPYELVKANASLDIWAFGLIVFYLLVGEALVPVNRDEDLAGPDAFLRAATWTDQELHVHIENHRAGISSGKAVHLLKYLLRGDPAERPQSMADVLLHPFFTEDRYDNSKDTKFIEFVKSKGLCRLDDVPEIMDVKWRFCRADLAMTGSQGATTLRCYSSEELQREVDSLLQFTEQVVRRSIQAMRQLSLVDRAEIAERVAEETRNYKEVQNSILTRLIISQEKEPAEAFHRMFALLKDAVEAQFPKRPPQTVLASVYLFSKAAEVKTMFAKV